MRYQLILQAVALLLLCFDLQSPHAACAQQGAKPSRVLTADQVQAKGLSSFTILDLSFDLARYDTVHLPGALGIATTQFLTDEPISYELPSLARLDSFFSAIGLPDTGPILLYGNASPVGHMYMALEAMGQGDRVHLLTGGVAAWQAAGFPISRTPHTLPARNFNPEPSTLGILTTAEVWAAHQDSAITLLDTRSLEEWNGAVPDSLNDLPRQGHIPGATYFPFYSFFEAGEAIYSGAPATLKSSEKLLEDLKTSGADLTRPLVTYCHVGGRAGFAYTLMKLYGIPNVKVYDGSMVAWTAQPHLPLVKGE